MSLIGILILIVIAAICGAIGQAIAGYSLGGCVISIVIGFIGALLGSWLSAELNLPEPLAVSIDGEVFPILWSIIGATLFSVVVGVLSRKRKVKRK